MSCHVSQNAEVAVMTGGQARVVGGSHVSQRQAPEEDATNLLPSTTFLPDVGGGREEEGRTIRLKADSK